MTGVLFVIGGLVVVFTLLLVALHRHNRAPIIVAALLTTATLGVGAASTAHAEPQPFRIVMVGDSIGRLVFPLVNTGPGAYWDAEAARSPYDTGGEDRASTVEALGVLTQSAPLGSSSWVVVQEGATGTKDGTYISLTEWADFVADVIRLTTGRCLLFVYPGYGHTINGTPSEVGNDIAYARTIIARDLFAGYPWRCIRTVNWWAAANANAGYLQADGLHPSAAGAQWIADQISAVLPDR